MKLSYSEKSIDIDLVKIHPELNLDKRYFVGTWVTDNALLVKGTYDTQEELIDGYGTWIKYARENNLDIPSSFEHKEGEIKSFNISKDADLIGSLDDVLKEELGFGDVSRT